MWYVMHVVGGREARVVHMIQKLVDQTYCEEAFVPRREAMRKRKGEWVKAMEILMPGYVFVRTKQVDKLATELHKVPALTRLLGSDDKFVPLNREEIAFLNAFTNEGERIVEMSEGIIEGDEVLILRGPLKDHTALIEKIDRHKRVAYLGMEMFGRKQTIKVGLTIVSKR